MERRCASRGGSLKRLKENFRDCDFHCANGNVASRGAKSEGCSARRNKECENVCERAKPWLKKSHGQVGTRLRNSLVNQPKGLEETKKREVKLEEWEVRQYFATNEAVLGRCS